MIILKSKAEIEAMKKPNAIVAKVLDEMHDFIKPGLSTLEIDLKAREIIKGCGAEPGFLGYGDPPFPGAVCVSVNEEVVHGIPSADKILQEGDIVSVDCGAVVDGWNGDGARTYPVGEISAEAARLIQVTEASFWAGLEQAHPGNRLGDISAAVQQVAEAAGYGVIRELTGHGVGRDLHEEPNLPNYGRAGRGIRLEEGMVLALEPMIALGSYRIRLLDDEWTIVTADGRYASHYEHTFAILADGPLILTKQA